MLTDDPNLKPFIEAWDLLYQETLLKINLVDLQQGGNNDGESGAGDGDVDPPDPGLGGDGPGDDGDGDNGDMDLSLIHI